MIAQIKLKFLKEFRGLYGTTYDKGKIIDYFPFNHAYHGMTEKERVEKGIFVTCHGNGEFNCFKESEGDVAAYFLQTDDAANPFVFDDGEL
jgi:hypothetical protein